MKNLPQIACSAMFAAVVMIAITGCHKQSGDPGTVNAAQDPAAANLADGSYNTAAPASTPSTNASTPAQSTRVSQATYQPEQLEASETPAATAPAPPPELPQYQQPACPGDGYIWTPGYWNYQSTGYYWVPGVWVRAPYEGALWTPGYWASRSGRYLFFRGHWGRHIGYYGGINYGYGYGGEGYEGGYWRGHDFNYNRTVNNINPGAIHNIYDYRVVNNDRGRRMAFNGPQGVQAMPRAAEFEEHHEPRALPMATQQQHEQMAQHDRSQFAGQGQQGHPGHMVAEHGLEADHNVRPMAREQMQNGRANQSPQQMQNGRANQSPQQMQNGRANQPPQQQQHGGQSGAVHPGAAPQHVQGGKPAIAGKPAVPAHPNQRPEHR